MDCALPVKGKAYAGGVGPWEANAEASSGAVVLAHGRPEDMAAAARQTDRSTRRRS